MRLHEPRDAPRSRAFLRECFAAEPPEPGISFRRVSAKALPNQGFLRGPAAARTLSRSAKLGDERVRARSQQDTEGTSTRPAPRRRPRRAKPRVDRNGESRSDGASEEPGEGNLKRGSSERRATRASHGSPARINASKSRATLWSNGKGGNREATSHPVLCGRGKPLNRSPMRPRASAPGAAADEPQGRDRLLPRRRHGGRPRSSPAPFPGRASERVKPIRQTVYLTATHSGRSRAPGAISSSPLQVFAVVVTTARYIANLLHQARDGLRVLVLLVCPANVIGSLWGRTVLAGS